MGKQKLAIQEVLESPSEHRKEMVKSTFWALVCLGGITLSAMLPENFSRNSYRSPSSTMKDELDWRITVMNFDRSRSSSARSSYLYVFL